MTLDARYFFACVVPFVLCTVCIFNALRINNAKRGFPAATMVDAGRANLIFLMPAPAGLILFPMAWHSTDKNTCTPYAISENHSVTSAIGTHS